MSTGIFWLAFVLTFGLHKSREFLENLISNQLLMVFSASDSLSFNKSVISMNQPTAHQPIS
jgi:hypothetical protein